MVKLLKGKYVVIFLLMFFLGFIIGYDYAVVTSRESEALYGGFPAASSSVVPDIDFTDISDKNN